MTIAKEIKTALERFEPGEVFRIQDFGVDSKNLPTLVRYLNRKVAKSELERLSKGRYFKPRNTRFGQIPPRIEEIIKDLLVKDGKITGYISGTPAFANFGLTTQISGDILIGSNNYRRPTHRGDYEIRFFLQRNEITEYVIPYLQLLDAIRLFREIPASTPVETISGITRIFSNMSESELKDLCRLALTYPNYVRALTGAILENIGRKSVELQDSINGVTTYKLNIPLRALPTKSNWNII